MKKKPYISILVAVRCDDWGGKSLYDRYQSLINYIFNCQQRFPGLFELCIAEYNPINDAPLFHKKILIPKGMDIKIWWIPNKVHKAIKPKRKFYATYPLNFLMKKSREKFILPTTQDIFFSETLLDQLQKKQLNKNYFYRIDRLDFTNENIVEFSNLEPSEQTRIALSNAKRIHVRHDNRYKEISFKIGQRCPIPRSLPNLFDCSDKRNNIIYCRNLYNFQNSSSFKILNFITKKIKKDNIVAIEELRKKLSQSYLFGLHTNACGDFTLASKDSFLQVRGYLETNSSNQLHTDTFLVAQLAALGLDQAIFTHPYLAFHTDHERGSDDLNAEQNDNWEESYNKIW